ncbi:MAG: phage major capsid protein [Alphaproteobacteria bacterium]
MPSPGISEVVTSTLQQFSGELADNVTKSNVLLYRLSQKDNIVKRDGGDFIRRELEYSDNGTSQWYSGYETLNVAPQDVFTAADFVWKQAAASVSMSGLEVAKNSGRSQIIDLTKGRLLNAERSLKNLVSIAMYADGSGNNGKEIGGLRLLVADNPTTGTVGGINRANWSFWRNYKFSGVSDGGAAVSSSNIQSYMNRIYINTTRGRDQVDLVVADNTYWRFYLESLQSIQRICDEKMASAGFQNLKYMGADVVFDGGADTICPANHMYFLNTDYIRLEVHKDRYFKPLDGERFSVNQDALVKLVGFMGNITLSNAKLQGVLIA